MALRVAYTIAILGVQMVDEERWVCVPLLEAVPEDVLDLRADVGSGLIGGVRRVDVRDQRQLLDERAVARLRPLARRDIDEKALPMHVASLLVAHRDCTVVHPFDRPIAPKHPVLGLVGVAVLLCACDCAQHVLAVERVEDLLEEAGVLRPLLDRVAEKVDDCRADVRRAAALERDDVERERHLFDEPAVALLERGAPRTESRLPAEVDEQPDERCSGERERQPVGDEADDERKCDGAQMEDDEAPRPKMVAEVAQAHADSIGIRGVRRKPCRPRSPLPRPGERCARGDQWICRFTPARISGQRTVAIRADPQALSVCRFDQ